MTTPKGWNASSETLGSTNTSTASSSRTPEYWVLPSNVSFPRTGTFPKDYNRHLNNNQDRKVSDNVADSKHESFVDQLRTFGRWIDSRILELIDKIKQVPESQKYVLQARAFGFIFMVVSITLIHAADFIKSNED
jgi:hypothetical protein